MAQYSFTTNADIMRSQYPDVANAFQALRRAIRESGPVPAKYRELMMLSAFVATKIDSGFKIHAKIARQEGATKEEVIQAVLIGLSATQGLSPTVDALQWVEDAWNQDEVV